MYGCRMAGHHRCMGVGMAGTIDVWVSCGWDNEMYGCQECGWDMRCMGAPCGWDISCMGVRMAGQS